MKEYKKIIISENIYEVNLKNLLLEAVCRYKEEIIWFQKVADSGILISWTQKEISHILKDRDLVSYMLVDKIYYAKVKEYKTWVVYDPFYRIVEYTDEPERIKIYETTKMVVVDPNPDPLVEKITAKIEERVREQKNKS